MNARMTITGGRILAVALLVGLLLAWSSARRPAVAQPARPNIILVLADDLDDAAIDQMPRLKQLLADAGTTMPNMIASVPLCCPVRSSLLRGQYAHNHGIYSNGPPEGGFPAFHGRGLEDSTVATWLHDAGYRTALLGKYLNRYPEEAGETYVPPGWDAWYAPVGENAYLQYNYLLNENGTTRAYGRRPEDYLGDVLTGHADRFVRAAVADGQPFFVYFSSFGPHAPSTPAPRHATGFAGAQAPRTPSFNEDDVSDKPAHIAANPPLTNRQIAGLDATYRRRLQSLASLEDTVERLIATLSEVGALDNTYVMFTSDHGYHLGVHRLPAGKLTPYEEDLRVRLLVRGPGVPAGRVVDTLAGTTDLAPTFAAIAGATPPEFVDGRSLLPLLQGQTPATWRQAFLSEGGSLGQTADEPEAEDDSSGPVAAPSARPGGGGAARTAVVIPQWRALRTASHKYVEYDTGERELYDLRADPWELENLAGKADPALISGFATWLRAILTCAGATCRSAEDAPPSR